jgi:hypothetical protein
MKWSALALIAALTVGTTASAFARGFDMGADAPSSGSFNGRNGAGAYNKNTGEATTYNKNTGTATTYNKNTNTATQYHGNTYNSSYNSGYHPPSNTGSYNGYNGAGAYNKNTGNAAYYNKNTGTATTYNKNTNTTTQYHNNNYSGYSNYHYNGTNYYVTNPHGYTTWGWHGGVVWAPTYSYWGGGFWGPFAAGVIVAGTTAAILHATTPAYPTSYVIASGSPGYTLLTSYGLRQVPCGPNLVVINYSGSVICAEPNATVPPGDYSVNVGTLTLVSS